MIPDLTAWGESLVALAGLFTFFVMFVQSIARLFDDRKS